MSEETTESTTADATTESVATRTDAPESATTTDAPGSDATEHDDGGGVLSDQFGRWVNYLLLAGLSLVVLIAGFRVYLAVDALIRRFVAREFQQVFYGVFNLALLLLAVAGILVQRRRMR